MVELAYLTMAITMVLALVRPLGKDLLVLAFAFPWQAVTIDIGVGLLLYQVIGITLAAKYIFVGQFQINRIPRMTYLLAMLLIGVIAATFTLMSNEHTAEIVGGEWRNGWRRSFVVLVVTIVNLLPIALVASMRRHIDLIALLRALLLGIICLMLVGYFQVITWRITGIDPLPIGVLSGVDEITRSAIVETSRLSFLRMCSLGGEPKSTAVAISIGLLLVVTFRDVVIPDVRLRLLAIAGLCLGLVLCMSSSAFATTAVGLPIALWMGRRKAPAPSYLLTLIPFAFSAFVLVLQFNYVSNFSLVKDQIAQLEVRDADFLGYAKHMTIDRIEVEDFDYLMIKSFLADPLGLIAGRGFGLGHLSANQYVPAEYMHYMGRTAISPKSANVLFLVNSGLVGLIYMLIFLTGQIPASRGNTILGGAVVHEQLIIARQALGVTVLIVVLLRAEQFAMCLFFLGAIGSLLVVQTVPQERKQRRVLLRWKSQPISLR